MLIQSDSVLVLYHTSARSYREFKEDEIAFSYSSVLLVNSLNVLISNGFD